MCKTKTSVCFLFSQPIIGCPLLIGKFWLNCSPGTQKSVRYEGVRFIEVFLSEFDRDSAGSLKKCPLLPGVRYIAGLTVLYRFDCIYFDVIIRQRLKKKFKLVKLWVFAFPGRRPNLYLTAPVPICIQRSRSSIYIYQPRPSRCIYRPWIIRICNNKSQRLRVMLPSLFLLPNCRKK